MSINGTALPPIPKPPKAPETETIELTLMGDLFADLRAAAKRDGMDLATAVAMCVQLWRYPAEP